MKKIILTVFVCVLFIAAASAQTDYAPTFTAGIKGGADLSSFPSNSGFSNNSKISWLGGFWGNVSLGAIDFQPEIYAIEKKVQVTYVQEGNVYTENSKFVTADVPLLFGGKFGGPKLGFRVYTGPVISFALSKVQSFTTDNFIAERLDYKDINYSWQFGAGVNVQQFSLDVRYEAGLDKTPYGLGPNTSTHLNIISIAIGYTLFSSYGYYTYQ